VSSELPFQSQNENCILTLDGNHALAFSTSNMIQSPDDRYRRWSGGCASTKVEPKNLRDIFLMRRDGDTPLMVIDQSILAGGTNGIILHAGLAISGEDGNHWMTSQSLVDTLADNDRAFRARDGPGTRMSTCLLGNILGSKDEACAAFESAATDVCRVLLDDRETPHEAYVPMLIHIRDLDVFKELLSQGLISDLSFRQRGYLSEAWSEKHYNRTVKGGGCERGRMVGTKRDEHHQLCVDGGGSERGRMVGTKRDEHHQLCVDGGGSELGRMADGPDKNAHTEKCMRGDAVTHIAKMVAGHEKMNALLLQLANGKLKQGHEWTESCRKDGNAVYYTFSNGNDEPIEGKRAFEEYLLKSYKIDELTEDGKSAYAAMNKKREAKNKKNAKNAKRKQHAN